MNSPRASSIQDGAYGPFTNGGTVNKVDFGRPLSSEMSCARVQPTGPPRETGPLGSPDRTRPTRSAESGKTAPGAVASAGKGVQSMTVCSGAESARARGADDPASPSIGTAAAARRRLANRLAAPRGLVRIDEG